MFLRHIMIGLLSLLVLLGHVPALVVGLGLTFAGDRHPHLVVALALPLALSMGGRVLQQGLGHSPSCTQSLGLHVPR